jgi:hypothetical protein
VYTEQLDSHSPSGGSARALPTATIVDMPPPEESHADLAHVIAHHSTTVSDGMVLCWRYGKTTQCLAVIDIAFGLLNTLFLDIRFVFALGFPCCGYVGAKRYQRCHTLVYLVYCVMISVIRIFQLVLYATNYQNMRSNRSTTTTHDEAPVYWLLIPTMLVQFWIAWIVARFWRQLSRLSVHERHYLSDYKPRTIAVLYH